MTVAVDFGRKATKQTKLLHWLSLLVYLLRLTLVLKMHSFSQLLDIWHISCVTINVNRITNVKLVYIMFNLLYTIVMTFI